MRREAFVVTTPFKRCRKESCLFSWCWRTTAIVLLLLPPLFVQSQRITPPSCFAQLVLADHDRSKSLSQTEFVALIDNLSFGAIHVTDFTALPEAIQGIFDKAACPRCSASASCCTKPLNIYGATPSDQASGRTMAKLVNFCHSIHKAIQAVTSGASVATTSRSFTTPSPAITTLVHHDTSQLFSARSNPAPSPDSFSFVLPTSPASIPGFLPPTTSFITASPTNAPPTSFPTTFPATTKPPTLEVPAPTVAPTSSNTTAPHSSPTTLSGDTTATPTVPSSTNSTTPSPTLKVDGTTLVPTRTSTPTNTLVPTTAFNETLAPTFLSSTDGPTQSPTTLVIGNKSISPNDSPSTTPAPFVSDSTPVPTLSSRACGIALSVSDQGRDGTLNSDPDYIRLLDRLGYSASSFSSLPEVLQANFFQLAGTGSTIDISGSSPGSNPSATQLANLENICLQTALAINAARSGATGSPAGSPTTASPAATPTSSSPAGATTSQPSSGSAPVVTTTAPSTVAPAGGSTTSAPAAASSSPAASPVPTISLDTCYTAMTYSDLNRDDLLNQVEYLRFLNRLSDSAFADATFSTLPTVLVNNFNTLATTNGEINVFGSKRGTYPDTTQAAFLSQVCTATSQAIAQSQTSPSSTVPTPPVVTPTVPPGGSPTVSPGGSPTVSPGGSPTVPPGGSPSPTSSTNNATQPTSSQPTTIAPTSLSNGPVPIISAFSISNTAKLVAKDLVSDLNRQGLEKAYKLLAIEVATNLSSTPLKQRQLRLWSRHLTVTFQNDSAVIDRIRDSNCSNTTASGSQCQDVIAHYVIVTANEKNVSVVQQEYIKATQAAIAAGQLGVALKKADPQSELSVVGAISIPENALSPTTAPSAAPVTGTNKENPKGGGGDSGGGGGSTGAIIGGILVGVVGLALIAWFVRRRSQSSSRPSMDDKFASAPKFDDIVDAQKPASFNDDDEQDFPDLEDSPVPKRESPDPVVIVSPKAQEQPPDKPNASMFGGLFRKKSSADIDSNKDQPAGDDDDDDQDEFDGSIVNDEPATSAGDNRKTGFGGLFGQKNNSKKKSEDTGDPFGEGKDDGEDDIEFEPSENEEIVEVETKKGGFNVFGMGGNVKKRHSDPGVLEASHSGGFGDQSVDFSEYSFDEPTALQDKQEQRHSAPPTFKDATSSSGWSTGDESPSSQDSFFESQDWAQAQANQISPAAPSQAGDKAPKTKSNGFDDAAEEVDFDDDEEEESEDEEEDDDDDDEEEEEEEEESYLGEDDSTYQSNSMKDEGTFDGTLHSASDFDRQLQDALEREQRAMAQSGGQVVDDDLIRRSSELDQMVEMEDWDGVVKAANHFPSVHEKFAGDDDDDSDDDDEIDDRHDFGDDEDDEDEHDEEEEGEFDEEDDDDEPDIVEGSDYDDSNGSGEESYMSEEEEGEESAADGSEGSDDPDDSQRRAEYRAEVEALVRMVVPDEIDNVDVMMTQFRGREAELVATLRTMQERSVSQRARAAVHRTKPGGPRSDSSAFSASPATTSRSSNGRSRVAGASARRPKGAFDEEEESEVTPNGW